MKPAFAAWCRDAPGSGVPRRERLAAHLAYVETIMDRILLAGPLKDASGAVIGSLLVYDAATAEEARALLEGDPYHVAGVWAETRIETFLPVAGTLVGGRNW
ncbi:MAG: YciI family protein [Allosphingosinicella sp.]|uniref:YciI family protein n=1 Tax=Allosphingosinicella sp. TaxID=2823234 RepID=UPI00393ECB2D